MPIGILSSTLTGKTQADGAQEIELGAYDSARLIQLQIAVSATPAAGTLAISIKSPGASAYVDLSHTIDLVNGPYLYQIVAFAAAVKITPASFDADKTYDVYLVAGDR